MAFDKMIVKKLLKKFDDVPFLMVKNLKWVKANHKLLSEQTAELIWVQ